MDLSSRPRHRAEPGFRKAAARIAALLLLAAPFACHKEVPDEPGAFTFRGQPVHPAAVSALYRSGAGSIDLAAFETSLEYGAWESQEGWWISEFETDPLTGKAPFFAYAAFAPVEEGAETYVLSVTFDTGETGEVDNLILVRKSGSRLELLRQWEEGRACNGGILAERVEGDNFLYSRELTPIGLLDLAPGVRLEMVAHEDLEATDDSCYAAANYVYSFTRDTRELVSIRLYDEVQADEKGRTEKFRHQSCFNRVFNAYLAEGKTVLKPAEIDDFARRFQTECLGADAPSKAAAPVDN